jgi:hypothetical protein
MVTLKTYVQDIPGSILYPIIGYPEVSVVFPSPSRKMLTPPSTGRNGVLPNPFQFITHYSTNIV